MAFQSLSTALEAKPRVLAGPLLRKVTPGNVTVWLALRKPGDVTLKVFTGTNSPLLEGKRHTVAIGSNLHIVAVRATLQPPAAELGEGVIYSYDLLFDFDDGLRQTLPEATANALLAYAPFTGPTFCLPPEDVNQLRLIHGSCRKPHGEGPDALALLDDLIAQTASNPTARPHQLLLTGDQIYADDVAYAMSMLLTDASEALLGWTEEFICSVPRPGSRRKVTDLYPGLRALLVVYDAGFTSVDVNCQLIGLGEYLAMYLFVWCEAPWPSGSSTMPSFEEIERYFAERFDFADQPSPTFGGLFRLGERDREGVNKQNTRLQLFRNALSEVRRALANIPSYMIFDDHEVTDDWNMTRNMCRRMYGNQLGLRIIQNALVAYSVCQHWGNAPEQFEDGSAPPGRLLLQLLDGGNADVYDVNSVGLRALVGIHDDAILATRPDNALFHGANALTYNYTVEGPGHQVIFTDTRTWRSFPHGGSAAPELMPKAQLQQQIVNTLPTGDRALLVVISTNAPPVLFFRSATQHPTLSNRAQRFPDIYESWELPTATTPADATDRLFKAISDKLPLVAGEHRGGAMLLSGDVHHSFASRLLFKGTTRFEDPQGSPQPVTAVFAQLVASSVRNEMKHTAGWHREGYRYAPIGRSLLPGLKAEGYAGWNVPRGASRVVGEQIFFAGAATGTLAFKVDRPTTVALLDEFSFRGGVIITTPSTTPDYTYRLEYLIAVNEGAVPPVPPPIPPIPSGATPEQRKQAAEAYHKATGSYRIYNKSNATKREVVGLNNLAEITFEWGSGDNKKVNHTLHWRNPLVQSVLQFTTYVVSLDPNDPEIPPTP